MRKRLIILLLFLILGPGLTIYAQEILRKPNAAGAFYPAEEKQLKNAIGQFLKNAKNPELNEEQIVALILPHAGYIYSGQVAAYGFKELIGRDFDTVIIIGPSHFYRFDTASVYDVGDYQTPLGIAKVDRQLCNQLKINSSFITFYKNAHIKEHAVEVEVPFIQTVLPNAKIAPIVMGRSDLEFCRKISQAIVKSIKDKKVLIIASSDMSHYHPYRQAELMDKKILAAIQGFSIEEAAGLLSSRESELCGEGPVLTTMLVCKELGATDVKILKYANSGDVTGDKSRVVGYCAVAFLKQKEKSGQFSLNEEEKGFLLDVARRTIEARILGKNIPKFKTANVKLNSPCGAFVTIHKHGALRGCIGRLESNEPLYQVVQKMGIAAATGDYRFTPVKPNELKDIDIEISVLTPLKKIKNKDEIKLGTHGIYITDGFKSGCFLPQVATETRWSKEEFINRCAIEKAGILPKDLDKATVYIFEAEVFSEKD